MGLLEQCCPDSLLGCAELVSIPRHFKLDDSLLPRRNVEGCHGRLGSHLDCWLLAVGYYSKFMDLAMYVSGGFAKRLIPSTAVHIRLL